MRWSRSNSLVSKDLKRPAAMSAAPTCTAARSASRQWASSASRGISRMVSGSRSLNRFFSSCGCRMDIATSCSLNPSRLSRQIVGGRKAQSTWPMFAASTYRLDMSKYHRGFDILDPYQPNAGATAGRWAAGSHPTTSIYGRITLATRQSSAQRQRSSMVALPRARASCRASRATSRPILLRCLKQSATVLATP